MTIANQVAVYSDIVAALGQLLAIKGQNQLVVLGAICI